MTLLEQIQNEAVDGTSDLGTLLRKCRVLAAKLKNPALAEWVVHELDGYPQDVEVPKYRILYGQAFGNFVGPMGSALNKVPLRASEIHERVRDRFLVKEFREGIAGIQATYESHKQAADGLRMAWPADGFAFYQTETVAEHFVLAQAWTLLPVNALAGTLSTIRNQILNFALEIAELNPDAGEAPIGSPLIPPEKTTQIFHNTIHVQGNVANLAGGNVDQQRGSNIVRQGDRGSLNKFLESTGLPKAEITALESALESDPGAHSVESTGHLGRWWNSVKSKVTSGAITLLVAGGQEALKQGIDAYFGH